MASLADVVRPPYRPEPGRGRGRPPDVAVDEDVAAGQVVPLPPLAPVERRAFDYNDLELGMAQLDLVFRRTRRPLDALVHGSPVRARNSVSKRKAPAIA
jgi:hypothetical protein